jgi:plasmid stabilization system protein ParE
MSYRVLVQPTVFQEIETSYRWLCDNQSPEIANNWYYELQEAISSLHKFPNRCSIAPESTTIDREIRQLWIGKRKNYRVLFIVTADVVAVLHVRHSSQSYLGEESDD